jgi:RNase P protein component
LREAFWSIAPDEAGGRDFVLVARPDVAGLLEREGATGIADALGGLMSEAGLARRGV